MRTKVKDSDIKLEIKVPKVIFSHALQYLQLPMSGLYRYLLKISLLKCVLLIVHSF